jgi:hypothetical protein
MPAPPPREPQTGSCDVVAFRLDGTFILDRVLRLYEVDGHLVLKAFQKEAGTLSIAFDDSSDPGLGDDETAFSFLGDLQQRTIDPTILDFLIRFDRVDERLIIVLP